MMWLILGLLLGAGFYWLATQKNFKVTWYDWVLVVLGVIMILFGFQNYAASLVELEPRAANIFLWGFVIPGAILIAIAAFLMWRQGRKLSLIHI